MMEEEGARRPRTPALSGRAGPEIGRPSPFRQRLLQLAQPSLPRDLHWHWP